MVYTADELADDSDDEKRLEKAEKAAERKAGLKKRKRLPSVQKPASITNRTPRFAVSQPYGNFVAPYPAVQTMQQSGASGRRLGGPATQRAVGPCFACGEMGHLRSYCPRTQSQDKKWYPFHGIMHDCASVWECEVLCCAENVVGNVGVDSDSGYVGLGMAGDECDKRPGLGVNSQAHSGVAESACDTDLHLQLGGCSFDIEASVGDMVPAMVVVKGGLKRCISFWRDNIKASDTILSIIEHGYVLPLMSEPSPHVQINHRSAVIHSAFVHESIAELLATGCVVEVTDRPHNCSPLSVVESSSGKRRLVINLRYLNRFLWKNRFKYEDLRGAMLLLERNDFMFSFDLKSGYHHVNIAQEHWDLGGGGGGIIIALLFSPSGFHLPVIFSPNWCAPWWGIGGREACELLCIWTMASALWTGRPEPWRLVQWSSPL